MQEAKTFVGCPKCEGTDFFINEAMYWKAFYDKESNTIEATKCYENEITEVRCVGCTKEVGQGYLLDQGIEINFS